jgi:hypothetical protein
MDLISLDWLGNGTGLAEAIGFGEGCSTAGRSGAFAARLGIRGMWSASCSISRSSRCLTLGLLSCSGTSLSISLFRQLIGCFCLSYALLRHSSFRLSSFVLLVVIWWTKAVSSIVKDA